MKIKEDYMYRKIAGQDIVIPVGKAGVNCDSLLTLKGIGAFIYQILSEGSTEEELVSKVLDTYDIDEVTARKDVSNFIDKLKSFDMLED